MSEPTETRTESPSLEDTSAGTADLTFDLDVAEGDRYHMIQEVAHGGAGRVLVARDLRLGREVALKEQLRRDRGRDRFVREAVITAQLQHPAIVPVHDAARRPDGSPFYIMKLVSGDSLDHVIDQKDDLVQRLALLPAVITVADAVAYAHSKRIIHRDLKPHNVLIGAFGETTLIDWGLAKRLDETDAAAAPDEEDERAPPVGTKTGAVIGTPAYMPPEQARGEPLDERADVHALGAMLYHVLAGEPAYLKQEGTTVIAQVKAGPPPPLTSRVRGVPAELVAIVDKAMARDPVDRYASAKELAEDLKRFQAGRLVSAHVYSLWSRIVRALRRNAAVAGVAAAAAVLLAVVGVVSVRRIVSERDRSQTQRAAAEELTEFMLADLMGKLRLAGKLDLLDSIGDRVSVYYDRLEGTGGLDIPALRHRAKALEFLGQVKLNQGHLDEAIQAHKRGLAYRYLLWLYQPQDLQARAYVGEGYAILSTVLDRSNAFDEALAGLFLARQVVEPLHTQEPQNDDWSLNLAVILYQTGRIQGDLRRTQEAATQLQEALALLEPLLSRRPGDVAIRDRAARAHYMLAGRLAVMGRGEAARPHVVRAIELFEKTRIASPDDAFVLLDLAKAHDQAGLLASNLGDLDTALREERTAVELGERLRIQEPTNLDWAANQVGFLMSLGNVEDRMGDTQAAIRHSREAVDLARELMGRDDSNDFWKEMFARAELDLAAVVPPSEGIVAVEACSAAAKAFESLIAKAPKENRHWLELQAHAEVCLADGYNNLKRPHDALPHARAGAQLLSRLVSYDPMNFPFNEALAQAQMIEAQTHLDLRAPREAIESLRQAVDLLQRLHARTGQPRAEGLRAQATMLMGRAFELQGAHEDAVAAWTEARAILQTLAEKQRLFAEMQRSLDEVNGLLRGAGR